MSPIHCRPADYVLLHDDVKSKLSLGIYRGTFELTDEPVNLSLKKLKLKDEALT